MRVEDGLDREWSRSDPLEVLAELRKLTRWVTDTVRIDRRSRYEMDWGCQILLLAAHGKFDLLRPAPGFLEITGEVLSLQEDYLDYRSTLSDLAGAELMEQVEHSILLRFEIWGQTRGNLHEIHALERFMQERDVVQLYFAGSKAVLARDDFARRVESIDAELAGYVAREAAPAIERDLGPGPLRQLEIASLPPEYWWRQPMVHKVN